MSAEEKNSLQLISKVSSEKVIEEEKINKEKDDLTFFDLSNPEHLNNLFERLESIKDKETDNESRNGRDEDEIESPTEESKLDHPRLYNFDGQAQDIQSGEQS